VNNQTVPVVSTLLRNKLSALTQRLQQKANPSGTTEGYNTLEQCVTEAIKVLSQFYQDLAEPLYRPQRLVYDTIPDAQGFNNNFQAVGDDLGVIFSEFENLEDVILGEFNYMVSRLNRLNRKLKSVSSQLGDFVLFSDLPTKDAIFFSDSFNNLVRVESNSPLLNADQCEINQVEGIVTLPIDRGQQVRIRPSETPVINSNSNGTVGNREELGAQFHGTITDILDGNSDTWFEYERVVTVDDGEPLLLDFTINLGDAQVINFLRINPNNFGARTQVEILAIDTSVDGEDFVSIKDDIPIADFVVEDEANIFMLAPATSKFAGQGLYSFTPRLAKYIHLTLRQTSPYYIKTSGPEKARYAIGIRDVEVQAIPYKPAGEIISVNYEVGDEVRKVVLLSNQRPSADTTSILASIAHYVSPDNGVTWYQIRPRNSAGIAGVESEVSTLLDFNGVGPESIVTTSPIYSLRYKALLRRDPSAFTSQSSELAQKIGDMTELHTPPTTSPFAIKLQNTPITNTVRLVDPQFGSRGKAEARYQIAVGTGSKLVIYLPFKPFKRDYIKTFDTVWHLDEVDPQSIYVGGKLWERGVIEGDEEHYQLNYSDGILEFGDDIVGAAVDLGAVVSMVLAEEQLFPSRGYDHIAELDYPTPNDQKQVEIYVLDPATSQTVVLKKGAKRHNLQPGLLPYEDPYKMTFSNETLFDPNKRQEFIDGNSELTESGMWSVDFTNGVLFSRDATPSDSDITVMFYYYPRTRLSEKDWKFASIGDGISNAISIADSAYKTFHAPTLVVPSGVKYFNLAHLGIVKGTVIFNGDDDGDEACQTEVEFIDGRSELLGVVQALETLPPTSAWTLKPGGYTSVYRIPFSIKVSSDVSLAVTFSNQSVFTTSKGSAVTDDDPIGTYQVVRDEGETGYVDVRLVTQTDTTGSVSYYYADPRADLDGCYSINYKTGEVFTYTSTEGDLTVDYEFTNYRIRYDIARLVPQEDWEFDAKENKITIRDREILRNLRTPQCNSNLAGAAKFYQVAYRYIQATRGKVSDLELYFSPVLKEYALKVITRSRLL